MMQHTRLLVSVRSAVEAREALVGGAEILDVKEPSRGSLGRAQPAVWQEVIDAAGGQAPVTVALGELVEPLREPEMCVPEGVWLVKVGLAGCRGTAWQDAWRCLRDRLTRSISPGTDVPAPGWVAVAYADWQRAAAPEPLDVAGFAAEHGCAALLLDTWQKDGTSLLEWLTPNQIAELTELPRERGLLCALAGSLRHEHIERLLPLGPDVVAVRGAACRRGQRDNDIDAHVVRKLAALVRSSSHRPGRQTMLERDRR